MTNIKEIKEWLRYFTIEQVNVRLENEEQKVKDLTGYWTNSEDIYILRKSISFLKDVKEYEKTAKN